MSAASRIMYTFDQSGNRTGVEKPDGSRTTTTYDYENRDIRVQLPSGIVNTMQYDPDGLRVLLQDSTGTTKFLYDNQQYLLQTNGSNVIVAVQTQEPGTYSNLISQYRLTNGVWLPSYHHYDALGNTTELTDVDEEVTDTYQYDAWGELLSQTGTTPNPFQWRGRYGYFTNPDTGEVYVLMRTYDPVTGTWTTLDILRFVDGLNMYLAYFVPGGVDFNGLRGNNFQSAIRRHLKEKIENYRKSLRSINECIADAFGIDSFFDIIINSVDSLTGVWLPLLTDYAEASGSEIYIPPPYWHSPTGMVSIVHEMIHVTDYTQKWYLGIKGIDNTSGAEGLAYGFQYMIVEYDTFARTANRAAKHDYECRTAQDSLNRLMTRVGNVDVFYGESLGSTMFKRAFGLEQNKRKLNKNDLEDLGDKLKLKPDCQKIVKCLSACSCTISCPQ